MRRRLLLATLPLAGCPGGQGDPITVLAVDRDDAAHAVARDERLVVANAVDVAGGDVTELGEAPWRRGRYRVTVRVDGEPVVARSFESAEWFNQLDVVIDADGSVELTRGRAA